MSDSAVAFVLLVFFLALWAWLESHYNEKLRALRQRRFELARAAAEPAPVPVAKLKADFDRLVLKVGR